MKRHKIILAVLLALVVALVLAFDPGRFFNLDFLKSGQQSFRDIYQAHPLLTMAAYFLLYVLVAATSLPGAAVLTLAGGALFGLVIGTLLVSFASSIGALLAFWTARYLLREWVADRFGQKLQAIDAGIERDGALYLFMLRLVPVFPFFLINLLMGLTKIRPRTFYWVSQVGMFAGTILYVNAGTQLAKIDSVRGILSLELIVAFVLLGVFPLLASKVLRFLRARQVYAKWPKPKSFDRNLVVIGAGAAGLVTSYIAAVVKAKVTLIEGGKMGGDCLNTGCVPSKALLHASRFLHQAAKAQALGISSVQANVSFPEVIARVQRVIRAIEPHDSIERYTALGVEVLQGHARIVSPWEVEVNGQRITTRSIVIATGARPFVPPIPGLEGEGFHTSETIWGITALPKRLVVLGGGPIGCELAQAFARLGSQVTQVEMAPRLLMREDPEVSALVAESLMADGVKVLTDHRAVRCERGEDFRHLVVMQGESERAIEFDVLLCAVGRVPRTEGFGLEELGIPLTPQKTVETDEYLQTIYPNILACGDVAGPYQFTHTAAHQAWYAAVNALFGDLRRFKADYSVIPWASFTDPEVARVGLSETEAKQQGIAYEVTRYELAELDRAIIDEAQRGFVKVLTVPGKDQILGVTIVGKRAGDLIAEFVLAMKHGLGLNKVLQTIHIYPTLAEANKYAAGEWKRAHAPQKLLEWVSRFHAWRRR
jgi:pyruvate/2-oxoglutarate dehydrogenase complex dihydrolipoamide dehydrogenase (E3) component/uncharacterized membrane protein YdjX (TVP38/TMEM64 family)